MENRNYEIYEIFYFDKDITSETIIEKVTVNERNLFHFYDEASYNNKIISFFGDSEEITKFFQNRFDKNLVLKNDKCPATIYGLISNKTMYLILSCDSKHFFHEKPLKKESLLILMKKYLQDILDDIFIIPDRHIIENWNNELSSPYEEEFSTIRKIEISEKIDEKLDIRDFDELNYNDVIEVLSENSESDIFKNNFSPYIWTYKIYNNKEKQEKSAGQFFYFIEKNLLKITKLKESEILDQVDKLGLNFTSDDLSFITNLLDESNYQFYKSMQSFKIQFRENFIKKQLPNCWKDYLIFFKKEYFNPESKDIKEKIDEFLSYSLNLSYEKIIHLSNSNHKLIIEINFDEFENFFNKFLEKISSLCNPCDKDQFVTKLIKNLENYLEKYNDFLEVEREKLSFNIDKIVNSLDRFHSDYIKLNSCRDCLEVNRIFVNLSINDQTKKTCLNLTQLPNKYKFDEMLFSDKIFKKEKCKEPFKSIKILEIFPTLNPTNYIMIIAKINPDNNFKNYYICFCYSHNVKLLTNFHLKKNESLYFKYFTQNEILIILEPCYNRLRQIKITKEGCKDDLPEISIDFGTIKKISDIIYFNQSNKYLILSKGILHEVSCDNRCNKLIKRDKIMKDGILCDINNKNNIKYKKIIYSGYGDFFGLQSNTTLDFYDINYIFQSGKSINVKNQKIKIFSDNKDTYLLLYDSQTNKLTSKIFIGCGGKFQILEEENKNKNIIKGNPIIDYIHAGLIKYGSKSDIYQIDKEINYIFYIPEDIKYNETEKNVINYFKRIFKNNSEMKLKITRNLSEEVDNIISKMDFSEIEMKNMRRILISRVPIQICTIENDNLVPLNDGKRIIISDNFIKMKKIEEKAKFLSFGYIEKLLKDINEDIFLVCIIGRQSSGKSYLLNRIFGTRFAVAATRCTDGIWVSYSYCENQHFIVFDCEGLFSRQRKEIEEIKLLTLLAAVSDFTYLNQDLTFNRHLNDLLNNLDKSVDRLNGGKLFKGKLIWTVRDVANTEKDGAYNEFIGHVKSFQKEGMKFFKKLFNGKIEFACLNNYENNSFIKEINKLRKNALKEKLDNVLKSNIHWSNGDELLHILKIILVQLYTDDDSNADEIVDQLFINELEEKLGEIWIDLSKEEKPKKFNFTYIKNETEKYEETFDLRDINLVYINDDIDIKNIYEEFIKKYDYVFKGYNLKILHNELYENFDKFLNIFKDYRLKAIFYIIEQNVKGKFIQEKEQKYLIDFKNKFSSKFKDFNLCKKKCSECSLLCKELKNHKDILEEIYLKKNTEFSKIESKDSLFKETNLIEKKEIENKHLNDEYDKEKQDFNIFSHWHKKKCSFDVNNGKIDIIKFQIIEIESKINNIRSNDFNSYISGESFYIKDFENLNNLYYNFLNNDINYIPGIENQYIDVNNIESIYYNILEKKKNLESNIMFYKNNFNTNDEIIRNCLKEKEKFIMEIDNLSNDLKISENSECQIENKKNEVMNKYNYIMEEKKKIMQEIELDKNKLKEKEEMLQLAIKNIDLLKNKKYYIEKIREKGSEKMNFIILAFIKCYFLDKILIRKHQEYIIISEEINKIQNIIFEYKNNLINQDSKKIKEQLEIFENDLLRASNQIEKNILEKKINIIKDELNNITVEINKKLLENEEFKKCNLQIKIFEEKQATLNNELDYIKNMIHPYDENITILKNILYNETYIILENNIKIFLEDNEIKQFYQNVDYTNIENIILPDFNLLPTYLRETLNELYIFIENHFSNFSNLDIENKNDKFELMNRDISLIKKNLDFLEKSYCYLQNDSNLLIKDFENLQYELSKIKIFKTDLNNQINSIHENIKIKLSEIENLSKNKISFAEENQDLEILYNDTDKLIKDIFSMMENIENLKHSKEEDNILYNKINSLKNEISALEKENNNILNEFTNSGLKKEFYTDMSFEEKLKKLQDDELSIKNSRIQLDNLYKEYEESIKKSKLSEEIEKIKEQIKKSCNCGTDHKCEFDCKICPKKKCVNKANHDGSHLCELRKHKCITKCDTKNCFEKCGLMADHEGEHKCQNDHICKEICKACSNLCSKSYADDHLEHLCNSHKCPHKCIVCKKLNIQKNCSSKDHLHDFKTEEIDFQGIQTKLHLCKDEHNCYELCNSKGTCGINYQEIVKTFESSIGENFSYNYLQPEIFFKKCEIKIPSGKYFHKGAHKCDMAKTKKHRCNFQCPDCKSICREDFEHILSHTFTHRNKENCFFTNETGENIIIHDEKGLRKYAIGEKAIAEDCYSSCKRRGRGHTHLIQCKGADSCLEKLPFIRHSKSKYIGFELNNFDELSCRDFWKHYNTKDPLDYLSDEIAKCNWICTLCETDDNKVFCSDRVLHSTSDDRKEHIFECNCNEKKIYKGIDICFCIDITGSMESFITETKNTIKNIIQNTKDKIENDLKSEISTLRISIVGYRDHCDKDIIESLPFSNYIDAERFLENIKATGGGDFPEAVADGLKKASEMNWSTNSNEKILFLILDAPPHGKKYHTFEDSYPDGCPCKIPIDNLLYDFFKKNINIHVLKIGSYLNTMEIEFKKANKYIKFIPLEGADTNSLLNFNDAITKIVCKIIKDKEMTVALNEDEILKNNIKSGELKDIIGKKRNNNILNKIHSDLKLNPVSDSNKINILEFNKKITKK